MTVQGIILENHGNITVFRGLSRDVLPVNDKLAGRNILQSGHHAQSRRLSAARRSHKNNKFAILDIKVKVKNRLNLIVIYFVEML